VDKLKCIAIFVEVARSRSFSSTANRLGIARSNVTKHVAWLERSMGVQLLARTTKSVALTESGRTLLENAPDLLANIEHIDFLVRRSSSEAKGILRVGAPPSFGSVHLAPATAAFSQQHPDVDFYLSCDYGEADLIAEGLDLSIRIAPLLKDSSHVAYRLAKAPQVLVAADSYLQRHGSPTTPDELKQHNCLVHGLKSPTRCWDFTSPEGRHSVRVGGSIRSNYGEALRHAALVGHGIAMHPTYMVANDLTQGRLVHIMRDYVPTELEISAIVPGSRHLPARVRVFLEFLIDWFRAPAWDARG